MHVVVFGLTISSSWGNGHATLWRSMVRALTDQGHSVTFYERNVPYYASTRDLWELGAGARLRLYDAPHEILREAREELHSADLALCTSFCPDGRLAADLILESNAEVRAFYDMDTPVTLNGLREGKRVEYLPEYGLSGFDLVLSYTGGRALDDLKTLLGARNVAALYGWVDPEMYRPVASTERFSAALSYLGTYSEDRQATLARLFLEPAAMLPGERFVLGGAQYPEHFPWASNIFFTHHLAPAQHPEFFCSSRATLNVTRSAMAEYGYCPSGRLFEAAACGVPLISDKWDGMESFFTANEEIFLVDSAAEVVDVLSRDAAALQRVGDAGRERTLEKNTAQCRATELEVLCEQVCRPGTREAIAS
jgi:spore maturation protein CgeB